MRSAAVLFGFVAAAAALGRTPLPIGELEKQVRHPTKKALLPRDVDPETLYPAYNMSVPIDHFHNETKYEPHSNGTFNLRYWFDASNYKPGGPVIVLQSGETDGSGRLPYLQKGIVAQLTQATGGIGLDIDIKRVILEHRYYGTSFPTPDLSTENLRFLTTEQALADQAYFSQNIVFPGLENMTLTSSCAPHIAYGGSYAGAFVAFLRKLYPDVYFGAIGSSGVVEAIYDYWEYYEPVRKYGPAECITTQQQFVSIIDTVLIGYNGTSKVQEFKELFGFGNLTHDQDFASILGGGIAGWQGRNWDPEVNDPTFSEYCGNISSTSVLYPATAALNSTIHDFLLLAGYQRHTELSAKMMNYIGWVNQTYTPYRGSLDQRYGTFNATYYAQDDISQSWRSWPYQYCSEWGYLQTGSGVPNYIMPMISRTIDLDYTSLICRLAFNITYTNTTNINKYGGWDISYPRLALIDGQVDPWRPATAHSPHAPKRNSTTDEPFFLIKNAVHHWDENGLFPNETTATLPPKPVADAQMFERDFVKQWMAEWNAMKKK